MKYLVTGGNGFIEDRPGHDFRYAIDTHRIFSELTWKPRHDFTKNIEKTVEWYVNSVGRWNKQQ